MPNRADWTSRTSRTGQTSQARRTGRGTGVLAALVFLCVVVWAVPLLAAETDAAGFRGIWLRPVANLTSVTLQLDNIQKAGFNAIYVETFYHGFTIYPSEVVPIRPEMKGTDYLKFYLDEGHKRGLQVHPWIEVFYWEVDTARYPQYPKTPLFQEHPEWRAILRDGKTTEGAESAHIFANPANPEVRRFLVSYIEELLHEYAVDGLNLDYIRYPDGQPDAGYDNHTRADYKKLTGKDPTSIPVDPDNADWRRWVEYREEQVLRMVREIKGMKDRVRKDAVLSAAIFPGAEADRYRNFKFQNWRAMVKEGLLDAIVPMCYAISLPGIEGEIGRTREAIPSGSPVRLFPVLAVQRRAQDVYAGKGHPPMARQAALIQRLGLPGFSVFCYDWMMDSNEGLNLLKGVAK